MKRLSKINAMQKAFTMVMAALVFILAVFVPLHSSAVVSKANQDQSILTDATYNNAPDLIPVPEPLPKLSAVLFALPKAWAMVLVLVSPQIKAYKAAFEQSFVQKICFVFVSTQAP